MNVSIYYEKYEEYCNWTKQAVVTVQGRSTFQRYLRFTVAMSIRTPHYYCVRGTKGRYLLIFSAKRVL